MNEENTSKNVRTNEKGYCIIKEWAEANGLEYSDTLKILRKNKITIKKFGNTYMLEKNKLDEALIIQLNKYEERQQEKIKKLNQRAEQKTKNAAFTIKLKSSSSYSEEIITQIISLSYTDPRSNAIIGKEKRTFKKTINKDFIF